jgi:hypothetical protein
MGFRACSEQQRSQQASVASRVRSPTRRQSAHSAWTLNSRAWNPVVPFARWSEIAQSPENWSISAALGRTPASE